MISINGFKLENLNMCELGNQLIVDGHKGFKVSKDYFESLGVNHTSVDWNGKNGSLPLDLNKSIDIGEFDVVTNVGVAEHVKNHKQCFENIYNLTRVGGIVIHLAPKVGSYVNHKGFKWYTEEWFYNHAKEKNYKILDIGVMNLKGKKGFDCIKCTFLNQENGGI